MEQSDGGKPDFTERRESGETIHDAGFIRLERDVAILPSGDKDTRYVVRHVGAVAIVPLTATGEIVLVHQYRYPVGKHMLEVPAGKLEAREDPLACAKRELQEETGYESDEWRWLLDTHSSVGFTDEKLKVYVATNARCTGAPRPDQGENVKPEPIKLATAFAMLEAGEITEGRTQMALLWLRLEAAGIQFLTSA